MRPSTDCSSVRVSLMDSRYGPPDWLPNHISPAWGVTVVEMDHASLAGLVGGETEIRERLGSGKQGREVGKRIGELDAAKRYAVVWLEVG
jgi:hypothetical protein